MTQTRKKWFISPNTKRKYAICIRCWSDGSLRHYVIERKSPNAIIYEFFKTYDKKELENKKTYECNANAKSLGMCKERV